MKRTKSFSLTSSMSQGDVQSAKEFVELNGLPYVEKWAEGYELLYNAIKNDYRDMAIFLLKNRFICNPTTQRSQSPLHIAVEKNDLEMVTLLLERSVDVNIKNSNGISPLHVAVENQNLDIIKLLLKFKADLNDKYTSGLGTNYTIEDLSVLKKNEQVINLFKEYAKYKVENINDSLYLAYKKRNLEEMKNLMDYGADVTCECPDETDGKKNRLLHLALSQNDEEIIELLLQSKNIDINIENQMGQTPIVISFMKKNFKVVSQLIDKGADLERIYINDLGDKYTLAYSAVMDRDHKMLTLLLNSKRPVGIDFVDKYGKTPLYIAYLRRDFKMMEMLLNKGANPNCKYSNNSPDESTLLTLSLKKYDKKMVEILLKNSSIVINQTDCQTLLLMAYETRDFNLMKRLIDQGANVNIDVDSADKKFNFLHLAIHRNDDQLVEILLKSEKIDLNKVDDRGRTPLFLAFKERNLNIMKLLVDKNADVNTEYTNDLNEKYTLIYSSVLKNDEQMIDVLLNSKNINLDFKDKNKKSCLIIAYERNDRELVKRLVQKGADVNVLYSPNHSFKEFTLIYLSLQKNDIEMVEILKKSPRLSVNTLDSNEKNLFYYAYERRDLKMMEEFISRGADINHLYSNELGVEYSLISSVLEKGDLEVCQILMKLNTSCHWNNIQNVPKEPKQFNPLYLAIKKQYTDIVKTMIDRFYSLSFQHFSEKHDDEFEEYLEFAKEKNNSEIINLFETKKKVRLAFIHNLENICVTLNMYSEEKILDILQKSVNNNKATLNQLLLSAVFSKKYKIAEMVVKFGADVNCKDSNADPVLHKIINLSLKPSFLLFFLENDADVNITNGCGETSLALAIKSKNVHYISVLLGFEANIFKKDDNGTRPVDEFLKILSIVKEKKVDNEDSKIADTFLHYIYFRKIFNISIHKNLIQIFEEFQTITEGSLKEVDLMKEFKIGCNNLTFFDFLKSVNEHKSLQSIALSNILDMYQSEFADEEWNSMYPKSYYMIKYAFYKAKKRKLLLNKLCLHIDFKLPFVCLDRIFNYLKDNELKTLINAYKNVNVVEKEEDDSSSSEQIDLKIPL